MYAAVCILWYHIILIHVFSYPTRAKVFTFLSGTENVCRSQVYIICILMSISWCLYLDVYVICHLTNCCVHPASFETLVLLFLVLLLLPLFSVLILTVLFFFSLLGHMFENREMKEYTSFLPEIKIVRILVDDFFL